MATNGGTGKIDFRQAQMLYSRALRSVHAAAATAAQRDGPLAGAGEESVAAALSMAAQDMEAAWTGFVADRERLLEVVRHLARTTIVKTMKERARRAGKAQERAARATSAAAGGGGGGGGGGPRTPRPLSPAKKLRAWPSPRVCSATPSPTRRSRHRSPTKVTAAAAAAGETPCSTAGAPPVGSAVRRRLPFEQSTTVITSEVREQRRKVPWAVRDALGLISSDWLRGARRVRSRP